MNLYPVDTHTLIQRHACNNSESNKDEKGENFADKLWLWLLLQFNFVAFAIHRFALVLALPFDRICTIWIPIKNRGKIYIIVIKREYFKAVHCQFYVKLRFILYYECYIMSFMSYIMSVREETSIYSRKIQNLLWQSYQKNCFIDRQVSSFFSDFKGRWSKKKLLWK